jgi:hypothetical protein
MAITIAAIDAICAELAAIPKKDDSARELNREEAIARMAAAVLALRERGYSWEEVATFISRKGCRISASALKTRLSRKGLTPKVKKRSAGTAASSAKPATRADSKAPQVRPAEPAAAQSIASRVTPPVPNHAPGSFTLREDSKDL